MSIALVQQKGVDNQSTGTPFRVNLTSGTTAGNFLLVVAGLYQSVGGAPSGPTVADSNSDTLTFVCGDVDPSGTVRLDCYMLPNAPGGITWFQATYSGGTTGSLVVLEYSGVATASPVDSSSTGFSGSTSVDPGALTTASGNLVLGVVAYDQGSGTATVASGFTVRANYSPGSTGGPSVDVADQLSSSSSLDPSWTFSASGQSVAASIAIKAGTGGGGGGGGGGVSTGAPILLAQMRRAERRQQPRGTRRRFPGGPRWGRTAGGLYVPDKRLVG